MQLENPRYNADGSIDVMLKHPVHGWIPFTARDTDEVGAPVFHAAKAMNPAPHIPTPQPPPPTPRERIEEASMGRFNSAVVKALGELTGRNRNETLDWLASLLD